MGIILRLFVTMLIVWLLLSGLAKPLLLFMGLVSAILVTWLSNRMRVLQHAGQPIYFRFMHIFGYWFWLGKQIFLSNIDVTRRVLRPKMPIKPTLRRVSATLDTEIGRVIYANSITLTPGTTAINITLDGDILVHALHEDSLYELEQGEMAAHIRAVEPRIVDNTK